jgi:putative transposase
VGHFSSMSRQRRVVLPGCPHHITQRGNNRRPVFFDERDREVYLALLARFTAQYSLTILGFCLMTNHVHLIVVPATPTSLAKALGRTHNDYARWLHIRRRESGHLWQNRFFSCPLEGTCTWAALAYVERNPVRAGLVKGAEDWVWSSARKHLNLSPEPDWLHTDHWSQNWTPALWRVVLEQGLAEAEVSSRLQEATQTGRPLGSDLFVKDCEARSGLWLRKQKPGPKPKPVLAQSREEWLYEGQ